MSPIHFFYCALCTVAVLGTACTNSSSADGNASAEGFFETIADMNSTSFQTYADPNENAFQVQFPEGWQSQVRLMRPGGQIRSCGFSMSPDGTTRLFFGDPSIPTFFEPNPAMGMFAGTNLGNPMTVVRPVSSIQAFLPDYVQRVYGQSADFQITAQRPNPAYAQLQAEKARQMGLQPHMEAVDVEFQFDDQGKQVKGKIQGLMFRVNGVWGVDVNGYLTQGSEATADQFLQHMVQSYQSNPQWQAQERARNQQAMAQSQYNHQQRMNAMQQNFQAHQNMMQQRYDAADARNQQWRQNQELSSQSTERFIDAIWDQQVISHGSQSAKVDAGYNYYYVNPNTNEYIGTDNPFHPDPSTYEQWEGKN
ncbi:MAG: hypothetical protein AAF399_12835 [Bacteroidota bacterium]